LADKFEELKLTHCYCIPDFQELVMKNIPTSKTLLSGLFDSMQIEEIPLRLK